MPATAMLRLGSRPDGLPVKFGGRFVEPACSNSVYRRKHQNKDDRALYVVLSCPYRLAFRAGSLPLPDPSRASNPLAAPEPTVAGSPPTSLMSSFSCCHCRTCTCTPGPPVVLCPLDVLLLLSEQPQSPCGREQDRRRKQIFAFDHCASIFKIRPP